MGVYQGRTSSSNCRWLFLQPSQEIQSYIRLGIPGVGDTDQCRGSVLHFHYTLAFVVIRNWRAYIEYLQQILHSFVRTLKKLFDYTKGYLLMFVKEEKSHSCHLDKNVPFDYQVLFSDVQTLEKLRKRIAIAQTAVTGQERVFKNVFDLHASITYGECSCDAADTSRYLKLDLDQRQESLTSLARKLGFVSRTVSQSLVSGSR
jgi:hypothetical protein